MTALAETGVTVLTHVGAGGDEAANERGSPQQLRRLIDAVPTLQLVAFHFGGYHRLDEAEDVVVGSRACGSRPRGHLGSATWMRPGSARSSSGTAADRVVFGSDWPMTDPAAEIAAVRALGLAPPTTRRPSSAATWPGCSGWSRS